MTTQDVQTTPTVFDSIGGAPAVDRLVEAFYKNMDTFEQARTIRAMHGPDLAPTRMILKLYLSEWLGGPKNYSETRGHPRLRMRHAKFAIGPAERDAWMDCMRAALEQEIDDAPTRARLEQGLAKLADWFRNDPENEHDKHH